MDTRYENFDEGERDVVRHVMLAEFWSTGDSAARPVGNLPDEELHEMVVGYATLRWQEMMFASHTPMPRQHCLEWHFAARLLNLFLQDEVLPDPARDGLSPRDLRKRFCRYIGTDEATACMGGRHGARKEVIQGQDVTAAAV